MTFLRLMASLAVVWYVLIRSVATQEATQYHLFATSVPEIADIGPDNPVNVGVRFTATQDGLITGIRFYKSPANAGPHVGRLWSSDGVILATVPFSDETASGWQEARLPQPVPITAGTTYIASYRTPTGHLAFTQDYFVVDARNHPLVAPASTAAAPNGVYTYEDDELPSLTYRASNFWVDVTFETTTSAAPTVIGVHPLDGAINATAPVEASFNVDIDPASLVFRLSRPDGTFVAGAVTYDGARRTARLTPERSLLGSTRYSASVSARATTGLTMASPQTWSFTTGAVGFRDTVVMAGLNSPTTFRFAPGGLIFVAEKSGIIKVFEGFADSTPVIFADLRTQVFNYWDRGLLGLALDPSFPTEPYVYVSYSHDAKIGGVAPLYGQPGQTSDSCPTEHGCVISARVSRLTAVAVPGGFVIAGQERVLVEGWGQQFPSHSIGGLEFGADGALYVTGGEGASYSTVDYGQLGAPPNPLGDTPTPTGTAPSSTSAEGGALRSLSRHRAGGGPVLLNGMVLRIDPATGSGQPDNPLAASPDANARRIIAEGLRNPYRFTIKPGTNEVWIGDVGWNRWEEINRIPAPATRVFNFGWPCYEGLLPQSAYEAVGLTLCHGLYASPGAVDPPEFYYRHSDEVAPGEPCATGSSAVTGLAFYPGGTYPSELDGALFVADFARGCIWAALADSSGQIDFARRLTIRNNAVGPVELRSGPGGDIFYVDLNFGTIRRIEYLSDVDEPGMAASIAATPSSGPAPLTVQFDGSQSSGTNLTYTWDFGDGTPPVTGGAQISHTYAIGDYTARLTVTDSAGATSGATKGISATAMPPLPVIDLPLPSLTFSVGDTITFSGRATDPVDGALSASQLSWALVMNHCSDATHCHTHQIQSFPGVSSGTFTGPDHEYPSYMVLTLTATNASGVSASTNVRIDPRTVALTFATEPAGLSLVVGSASVTAPSTQTLIVGSLSSMSAPPVQSAQGTIYRFVGWSNARPQTHDFVAPSENATFTAVYRLANAVTLFGQSTPATLNAGADNPVELGVKFTADVSGTVTGVRFYKSSANTGTHVGSLWTLGGTRLAQVTFTQETASGWQEARFGTAVAITAGTTYVVSYHTTVGHYSTSSNFFTSPHNAGVLHAPTSNGIFKYGPSGSFPISTFGATNYWVDVVFVPDGSDVAAPAVTNVTPASGSTGVPVTQPVSVTFSEAVSAASLTSASFTVVDDGGAAVPGTVSYDAATFTARFAPSPVFACGKTHVVRISGGLSPTPVTDLAGNALMADVTSTFAAAAAGCLTSMIYPVANATDVIVTRDFEWAAVPGADAYILHIGTAPNTWDVHAAGLLTRTTYRIPIALPSDRTLYVRVGTRVGGVWRYTSSVPFTAAASVPSMVYPTANQTGVTISRSFEWTPVAGADAYILHIGSAPGTWDVTAAGLLTGGTHLVTQALPSDRTLYTRVGGRVGGVWRYSPSIPFTAAQSVATMVYPVANQTNAMLSRDFEWTPVPGADAYILHVGTAPNTWNLVAAGLLTASRYRVTQSLPFEQTLYVRVGARVGGLWRYSPSIPFQVIRTAATMVYPTANQTDVVLSRDFEWTPVPGADAYILHIGRAPNTWDVLAAGLLSGSTYRVTQVLPSDQLLHVRVGARVGGVWNYANSISFRAAPAIPTMVYPLANATGVVTTRDFEWTAVPGADAYILHIGTAPDTWDVLAAGLLTQTKYRVTVNLPTDRTLYVRVRARVGGVWRNAPSIPFTVAQ